ncbi:MAG: hypothetical protein AAFR04_00770 [Pseudomonadota bacterium]
MSLKRLHSAARAAGFAMAAQDDIAPPLEPLSPDELAKARLATQLQLPAPASSRSAPVAASAWFAPFSGYFSARGTA